MAKGQGQAAPDAVLTRIGQVAMLHHAGDREEARHRFLGLWAEIGEHGDALHRCTLAHYLADTQDDPEEELAWDLRALSAAEELTEDLLADRHESTPAARALYPSLHLNVAADYDRLGHREAARLHLRRGRGHRGLRTARCPVGTLRGRGGADHLQRLPGRGLHDPGLGRTLRTRRGRAGARRRRVGRGRAPDRRTTGQGRDSHGHQKRCGGRRSMHPRHSAASGPATGARRAEVAPHG